MQYIFNIFIFGAAPTYLYLLKNDWAWWLGYVIIVLAYYILNRIISNIRSAINIAMAKVTYNNLSEDDQFEVDMIAEQILEVYEWDVNAVFESELQQLGYTALAMRNLGIKPDNFENNWYVVTNPSKVPSELWTKAALGVAKAKLTEPHA